MTFATTTEARAPSTSPAGPPDTIVREHRGLFAHERQVVIAILATIVIVAVGTLTGVSQYASARRTLIQEAENGAKRFNTVFREASEARLQALRLGAEIAARDDAIAEALKRRDKSEMARRTLPLFEQVLKPRFGVIVFDFQTTEGTMLYRAHRPAQFNDDVSRRPMVVTAQKSRTPSAGLDIGRSGPELRAMTPVFVGDALVGSLELGSPVGDALRAGYQATGLDFAFGMDRTQAEAIDRVAQPTDLIVGDSVYFTYSRPEVRELLAPIAFNPLGTASDVRKSGDQQIFLQTFPVLDVGRRPVTRVTLVKDLTPLLDKRRDSIILYTSLVMLAIVTAVSVGLFQFEALRTRLERSFSGRMQDLRKKARAYDEMRQAQVDARAWKIGLLSELVLLIKDPLAAVDGALALATGRRAAAVMPDRTTRQEALTFAADEIRRLNAAVDDQARMIQMRDDLRRVEPQAVDLATLIADIAHEAGAARSVTVAKAADIPRVRGDSSLVLAALRSLVQTLQRWSDAIPLAIEARHDGAAVVGSISVPGAWQDKPPSLDEAAAFGTPAGPERDGVLILARLTFERFGGTLAFIEGDAGRVGFTFALAVA